MVHRRRARRPAAAARRLARLLRLGPERRDPLTGLGTRAVLGDLAARLEADPRPRALLVLDLDGFKHVNDTLGHPAGDAVLAEVGARIAGVLGPEDTAVRLGGDEFAVLTGPLAGSPATGELAARLLDALATPVAVDDLEVSVGVSLGSAVRGADGRDLEELLRSADHAMYRAKADRAAGGRRRPVPGAWRGHEADGEVVDELRRAVAGGQLLLHYQPQVAWTGEVVGFEALLRWQHPRRGLLAPSSFLPVAERNRLLTRLTLVAVEQALAARGRLAAGGAPDAGVSVNVAARDLLGRDLLPQVAELLQASGEAPGHLVLEVSEPGPFPLPAVEELFADLDRLGVGLSIHEFGTGQSSLTALSRYAGLRELKVDPTLVGRVADDPAAARLVRALVSAAHGLEVVVVAEGVEDAETAACLGGLGCDRLQGFWIGPPGDVDTTLAWLDRWRTTGPDLLRHARPAQTALDRTGARTASYASPVTPVSR